MRSGPANGGRAIAAEPSSPELALVDHELAARARERLSPADDTIERVERAIALRRLTALAEPVDGADEPPIASRAIRPRTTRLTVAAAVAATLFVALLLGVEVDLRGNPAGADPFSEARVEPSTPRSTHAPAGVDSSSAPAPSHPTGQAPVASQKSKARAGSTSRGDATTPKSRPSTVGTPQDEPTPRRFAWAPVASATAYHVEFFRGSTRVYASRTADPQFDLPRRWKFSGRAQRLSPGTYRWYVWPIRSGRRSTTATVQAELIVR